MSLGFNRICGAFSSCKVVYTSSLCTLRWSFCFLSWYVNSLLNLWPKNKSHQQYLEHPMGRCANHVTDSDVQDIYTVWTRSSPLRTKIMPLVIVVLNLKPVLLSANIRNRPAAAHRSGYALKPNLTPKYIFHTALTLIFCIVSRGSKDPWHSWCFLFVQKW
jgi:hypothetical protein